jgi:mRNA-degrading endonuclease toxin of MazEF toxin-antitoxin module
LKPGDVIVGAFPGAQVTKSRPAVVLSTEDYHRNRPDVVVGLITTQAPKPLALFRFRLEMEEAFPH